jgi:N-6 DNA Methylase
MSLELAHQKLGWPSRDEILKPPGEGALVFARLAEAKIGSTLAHQPDGAGVRVGILSPNPDTSATEPPLAVVCEFQRSIGHQTLREMQKLAWNFSRCPMFVTVEPHLLRAWTCCEPPSEGLLPPCALRELPSSELAKRGSLSTRAAQALHWVNLVSGQFFRDNASRFRRDQRADQLLLENLRFVRQALCEKGLANDDVCHDLLARVIFIQFLFDRKDSNGRAALNAGTLERLHDEKELNAKHENFASILADYEESYRLFHWLNNRFNGDLFPGKGDTEPEREKAWQAEKRLVKPAHLKVLEQFVSGRLEMPRNQFRLWREYAFDAIPLEFISSIYEAFVSERARKGGIYYTPPHLVDFTLDRVLPWDSDRWDLKVLDPACGSGVFLVKAFQRLIHRWKKANPGQDLRADTLRRLLENNLFGVDRDPHAVRVASFSLYLAMCDEIDPKHYWTQVRFPQMRDRRLINADFFCENQLGFRTKEDAGTYDLVVGNAPWGEGLRTKEAKDWAADKDHKWPVANKGIGTLFLPKAAALTTKQGGKVAMIQSASSLLFNRSGPACEFRKKFFKTFGVEQVVNLSALRFRVFNKKKGSAQKAVAPACVVVFSPESPTGDRLLYLSPKLAEDDADEFNIVVEPADVKEIYAEEAGGIPEIWTAFLWGNRRDWALIRHLRELGSIEKDVSPVNFRRGIEFGNRKKLLRQLEGRRILFASDFPQQGLTYLHADSLPEFTDPKIHSKDSTDFGAFDTPQLVIKRSWRKTSGRFQARLVKTTDKEGVLCTQSYATVHVPDEDADILAASCLTYNSILAVYFLLLTSGRFASYRPEPLVEELLRVPIPSAASARLESVKTASDCDEQVRQAFDFKDAEWTLVEDLFDVTLPDFKGDEASPGRQRTKRREKSAQEPQLWRYCEYFIRVLKAGFGRDKQISATIFQEKSSDLLPFRLVAFQFDQVASPSVHVESLDTPDLLTELEALNKTWLKHHKATSGNVYCQRVARIYDRRGRVPTVLILKPDACRYWTRSMGLHDADEVAADFFSWQANAGNKSKEILVEAMHFGESAQSDTTTKPFSTIKPGRPA